MSVENPAKIKYFIKSQLSRTKTDAEDAKHIAYFCKLHKPDTWKPAPKGIQVIKAYACRIEQLTKMLTQKRTILRQCKTTTSKKILQNRLKQ